jgi:superfamily I DNA/RNA helicase
MFTKTMSLTPQQRDLIAPSGSLFLEGAAGTGKTTVAVERLRHLLQSGVPAEAILVLVPQRALAQPYHRALRALDLPPGGEVTVTTMSGIAVQTIELFWPLIAKKAGFSPDVLPTFLTLETSQYVMARVADELIDQQGYFASVTVNRGHLYTQIIDNLNKSAVVGFPVTEIGQRLRDAWLGDPGQNLTFEQVQDCANRFRAYCVAHTLLDFSLQMEIFVKHLWSLPAPREFLTGRYRHLIADNIEEDNAAAQDILRDWLPQFDSALLVYDSEAGYRTFLGADADNAYTLRALCDSTAELGEPFVNSPDVYALGNELGRALGQYAEEALPGSPLDALHYEVRRFYPEMLDAVADEIRRLVQVEGVPPGEIVVLAPMLPDSLRFALLQRLEGIPTRSHRPSRGLREEPAVR